MSLTVDLVICTHIQHIEINLAKTTRTVIWPLELEGVRRMENTLETLKCQKPLIQGFRHVTKSHTEVTRKRKSCKWMQECISKIDGLINIITDELVLAYFYLGKLFGLGEDALAYALSTTLFQKKGRDRREAWTTSLSPSVWQHRATTPRRKKP
jgi:hypothetical protein